MLARFARSRRTARASPTRRTVSMPGAASSARAWARRISSSDWVRISSVIWLSGMPAWASQPLSWIRSPSPRTRWQVHAPAVLLLPRPRRAPGLRGRSHPPRQRRCRCGCSRRSRWWWSCHQGSPSKCEPVPALGRTPTTYGPTTEPRGPTSWRTIDGVESQCVDRCDRGPVPTRRKAGGGRGNGSDDVAECDERVGRGRPSRWPRSAASRVTSRAIACCRRGRRRGLDVWGLPDGSAPRRRRPPRSCRAGARS